MNTSRLTQEGQAIIPEEIRKYLSLKPGDNILFDIENDKVIIKKIPSLDVQYAKAIEKSLSSEWDSPEDNEAYNDL